MAGGRGVANRAISSDAALARINTSLGAKTSLKLELRE